MKFTSEDLMKAMGLKVGDRVKFLDDIWVVKYDENEVHEVYLHRKYGGYDQILWLTELIDKDIEILPQPKKVGDLQCKDFKCDNCPLKVLITCNPYNGRSKKLFDNLAKWTSAYGTFDQEIYDILKARLDKEVEENVDKVSN